MMPFQKNMLTKTIVLPVAMIFAGCSSAITDSIKYPNGRLLSIADAISIFVWTDAAHVSLPPVELGKFTEPTKRLCSLQDLKKGGNVDCFIVLPLLEGCLGNDSCRTLSIDESVQKDANVSLAIQNALRDPCAQLAMIRPYGAPSKTNPDIYIKGLFYSLYTSATLLRCEQKDDVKFLFEQQPGKIIINLK